VLCDALCAIKGTKINSTTDTASGVCVHLIKSCAEEPREGGNNNMAAATRKINGKKNTFTVFWDLTSCNSESPMFRMNKTSQFSG
jgi:hypothetical protein